MVNSVSCFVFFFFFPLTWILSPICILDQIFFSFGKESAYNTGDQILDQILKTKFNS